jgi:transposase-like protein
MELFWSFAKRRLNKFNRTEKYFELRLKDCKWNGTTVRQLKLRQKKTQKATSLT